MHRCRRPWSARCRAPPHRRLRRFVLPRVFARVDVASSAHVAEGACVGAGSRLVDGARPCPFLVLMGERVSLNFVQRMCGVATPLGRSPCLGARRLASPTRARRRPVYALSSATPCGSAAVTITATTWAPRLLIKDNHVAACGGIKVKRSTVPAPPRAPHDQDRVRGGLSRSTSTTRFRRGGRHRCSSTTCRTPRTSSSRLGGPMAARCSRCRGASRSSAFRSSRGPAST